MGLVGAGAIAAALYKPFPADTTPEGAYLRVARAFTAGKLQEAFAYTETEAQWASYSLRDNRREALALANKSFPAAEKNKLESEYGVIARCPDGADVFARYAVIRKWDQRLRKDLSGIDHVERDGERATIVTARGTRYTFRRRDNGIWGMTMFTPDLVTEAARSARDLTMVKSAAEDYARAKPSHGG